MRGNLLFFEPDKLGWLTSLPNRLWRLLRLALTSEARTLDTAHAPAIPPPLGALESSHRRQAGEWFVYALVVAFFEFDLKVSLFLRLRHYQNFFDICLHICHKKS